ncbi:MAG: protein-disulfide reductase DsbD domain-containing protein, partial [Thermodesulfobacteriota bacterium]
GLIASVKEIKPGDIFRVGVLFEIDPTWHISWKNPGDSGLPTSVSFSFPEGFTVGELEWPIPIVFKQPGGIVDYGYKGSILLLAEVKSSLKLSEATTININADVSWTSCSEICIPGKANLDLEIPLTDSSIKANAGEFGKWMDLLPTNSESSKSPFIYNIDSKLNHDKTKSNFTLSLNWKMNPKNVEWIPDVNRALEIENISVNTRNNESDIVFSASKLKDQTIYSNKFDSIVTYVNEEGKRRGVSISIPLKGL